MVAKKKKNYNKRFFQPKNKNLATIAYFKFESVMYNRSKKDILQKAFDIRYSHH